MMSRSMVLVFLLVVLIFTSQFEWKQQLVNETEGGPGVAQKQQQQQQQQQQRVLMREEVVKEKIIMSQEKNIQRLNDLVQSLQQQLLLCQCSNNSVNITGNTLAENVNDFERQQSLED